MDSISSKLTAINTALSDQQSQTASSEAIPYDRALGVYQECVVAFSKLDPASREAFYELDKKLRQFHGDVNIEKRISRTVGHFFQFSSGQADEVSNPIWLKDVELEGTMLEMLANPPIGFMANSDALLVKLDSIDDVSRVGFEKVTAYLSGHYNPRNVDSFDELVEVLIAADYFSALELKEAICESVLAKLSEVSLDDVLRIFKNNAVLLAKLEFLDGVQRQSDGSLILPNVPDLKDMLVQILMLYARSSSFNKHVFEYYLFNKPAEKMDEKFSFFDDLHQRYSEFLIPVSVSFFSSVDLQNLSQIDDGSLALRLGNTEELKSILSIIPQATWGKIEGINLPTYRKEDSYSNLPEEIRAKIRFQMAEIQFLTDEYSFDIDEQLLAFLGRIEDVSIAGGTAESLIALPSEVLNKAKVIKIDSEFRHGLTAFFDSKARFPNLEKIEFILRPESPSLGLKFENLMKILQAFSIGNTRLSELDLSKLSVGLQSYVQAKGLVVNLPNMSEISLPIFASYRFLDALLRSIPGLNERITHLNLENLIGHYKENFDWHFPKLERITFPKDDFSIGTFQALCEANPHFVENVRALDFSNVRMLLDTWDESEAVRLKVPHFPNLQSILFPAQMDIALFVQFLKANPQFLEKLTELDLSYRKLIGEWPQGFELSFPALKRVSFPFEISIQSLFKLLSSSSDYCAEVRHLDLSSIAELNDDGKEVLIENPFPQLERITYPKKSSARSLFYLLSIDPKVAEMTTLNLSCLTDDSVRRLKEIKLTFPHVKTLIPHPDSTAADINWLLKACPNLQELNLRGWTNENRDRIIIIPSNLQSLRVSHDLGQNLSYIGETDFQSINPNIRVSEIISSEMLNMLMPRSKLRIFWDKCLSGLRGAKVISLGTLCVPLCLLLVLTPVFWRRGSGRYSKPIWNWASTQVGNVKKWFQGKLFN